jgi:hypothetical protein
MLFARHYSHILASSIPPGGALAAILFVIFNHWPWYYRSLIAVIPFCLVPILWLLNPFVIERCNAFEVDNYRKKIALLCIDNLVRGVYILENIWSVGNKDDLVFIQALKPFKKLMKINPVVETSENNG